MSDLIKCGKCGANISPGYDFCLSCGTKFSEIPPKTVERDSWWGKMLTFICAIIIFAIIFLIFFLPAFFAPQNF